MVVASVVVEVGTGWGGCGGVEGGMFVVWRRIYPGWGDGVSICCL